MSCWNPEIPLGLRLMENWNFWPCLPMAPFRPSSFMAASLLLLFIVKQESSWVIEDWPRVLDSCKNILEKFLLLLLVYIFMHQKTKFKKERKKLHGYLHLCWVQSKSFHSKFIFPQQKVRIQRKTLVQRKSKENQSKSFRGLV